MTQTEDGISYNRTFKVDLLDTLKDNLINVVFSKCNDGESAKSSEMFLRMVTKVLNI